jgi:hypothetical protein
MEKPWELRLQKWHETTVKGVMIPLGDSIVPVTDGQKIPEDVGHVKLSRNEIMRLRSTIMSGASESEAEFHVEFSNWRRRHQAISKWHHHARRLHSAALASQATGPGGRPRKVTRHPGTASPGRSPLISRKLPEDHFPR